MRLLFGCCAARTQHSTLPPAMRCSRGGESAGARGLLHSLPTPQQGPCLALQTHSKKIPSEKGMWKLIGAACISLRC